MILTSKIKNTTSTHELLALLREEAAWMQESLGGLTLSRQSWGPLGFRRDMCLFVLQRCTHMPLAVLLHQLPSSPPPQRKLSSTL